MIASPHCNIVLDDSGKLVIASGIQDVLVWNIQGGTLEFKLKCPDNIQDTSEIHSLAKGKQGSMVSKQLSDQFPRDLLEADSMCRLLLDMVLAR